MKKKKKIEMEYGQCIFIIRKEFLLLSLHFGETTEEDRPKGIGTESIVGKEIADLGHAKLSMPFVFGNKFFILSDILVLTHALSAETVTESSAMDEVAFTESKCSEEIADEIVEEEDE